MQLQSYLIVGSGVWGASTALRLIQTYPRAHIAVVDQYKPGNPKTASADPSKIIRIEYADADYVKLALEAQDIWRNHAFYSTYYRPASLVRLASPEGPKKILDLLRQMGIEVDASIVPLEDLYRQYPGVFELTNTGNEQYAYVNRESGWAHASDALKAVIHEAIRLGVTFEEATISQLEFDTQNDCIGVRTTTGRVLTAANTILAAGPGSIEILANSCSSTRHFDLEERLVATGVVSGVAKLTDSQNLMFQKIPVFVRDLSPIIGEVIPPFDRRLKMESETGFKRTIFHQGSGQRISIPPPLSTGLDSFVPSSLRKELGLIARLMFGPEGAALDFDSIRICWDAYAVDGGFIISPVEAHKGLYLASGGSFHSWKFLPVLGKLVVDMLQGQLDPRLVRKWDWARNMPKPGQSGYKASSREWDDLARDDGW